MSEERLESYLQGRWQTGQQKGSPLVNPATEEVIAWADTTGLDLGAALAFARDTGGRNLRSMSFAARGKLLGAMREALHGARERLIDSAVVNGGCTRGDAKFDVDGAIGTIAAYAELGQSLGELDVLLDGEGVQLGRSPKFWGQHIYLPRRGAAVFINAFNFPAWGFAEKAACAILAGMPVVSKPATSTAHTAYLLTKVLVDANILPEGVMSFIAGAPGELLDRLESQDVLAFTGSAMTGRRLRQHPVVVEKSVPVNVEADSLNAAVLGPDAELGSDLLQLFLRDVSTDMTQKTGQKCTAIRRIFVPANLVDGVVEALSERLREVVVGNPAQKEVRMGPLATQQQLADVKEGTRRLREESELVFGAPDQPVKAVGVSEGKGYFFPITLLKSRDSAKSRIVHEHEVFGPVATILPYDGSAESACELVARGGGSLVSSIFTDDKKFLRDAMIGMAPYNGRLYLGSEKILDHTFGPGTVLPLSTHGGPGRAGGGEELGGIRGVKHFMQRTSLQGYRPLIEKITS